MLGFGGVMILANDIILNPEQKNRAFPSVSDYTLIIMLLSHNEMPLQPTVFDFAVPLMANLFVII